MTNVYSVDVKIWATAYIKADTPKAALVKARNNLRGACLEVDTNDWKTDPDDDDTVRISGREILDPYLPKLSLSPMMTIDHEHLDSVSPDELELVHESLRAEADAPHQQVHQGG